MANDTNPFASPLSTSEPPVDRGGATGIDPYDLRPVSIGLRLIYIAICGFVLAGLGGGILVGALGAGGVGVGVPELGLIFGLVFGLLLLAMAALQFVGLVFCVNAPPAAKASPVAIATLAFVLAGFGVSVVGSLVFDTASAEQAVEAFGSLLGFAAPVCFLVYMRRIANYIGRPDVAARSTRVFIAGGVAVLLVVAGDAVPAPTGNLAMAVPLVFGFISFLVAFLMYANMVAYLRKAVDEAGSFAAQ
ncbi:MAG: hypothetical protein AAF790_07910 [Planctomycetota bacterium]